MGIQTEKQDKAVQHRQMCDDEGASILFSSILWSKCQCLTSLNAYLAFDTQIISECLAECESWPFEFIKMLKCYLSSLLSYSKDRIRSSHPCYTANRFLMQKNLHSHISSLSSWIGCWWWWWCFFFLWEHAPTIPYTKSHRCKICQKQNKHTVANRCVHSNSSNL